MAGQFYDVTLQPPQRGHERARHSPDHVVTLPGRRLQCDIMEDVEYPQKKMSKRRKLGRGTEASIPKWDDQIFTFCQRHYNITTALRIIEEKPRSPVIYRVSDFSHLASLVDVCPEHAEGVDLTKPCILAADRFGKDSQDLSAMLIDGWHRLYKARKQGLETISCYRLCEEETKLIRIDPRALGMSLVRAAAKTLGCKPSKLIEELRVSGQVLTISDQAQKELANYKSGGKVPAVSTPRPTPRRERPRQQR
jgi:hypothetical protein